MGATVSNVGMHWDESGVDYLGFTVSQRDVCRHDMVVVGKAHVSADRATMNGLYTDAVTSEAAFLATMAAVLDTANKAEWDGWSAAERTRCWKRAKTAGTQGWWLP